MPPVVPRDDVERAVASLGTPRLVDAMQAAFSSYSAGRAEVAPVQHLGPFRQGAPGDFCVKSGYVRGAAAFVVKVAGGGFRGHGSSGFMAAFSQTTGKFVGILLDDGWLTDARTGAAGALCARLFAPAALECVGVIGTGVQARFQLDALRSVTACRKALVWGRRPEAAAALAADARAMGWDAEAAPSVDAVLARCRLVITVTSATTPVVPSAGLVRPGTTVVAVGSDGIGKQELAAEVTAAADLVVCDSVRQCAEFGELSFAIAAGALTADSPRVKELGAIDASLRRAGSGDARVIVCDLTGIAVQDVAAATLVLDHLVATKSAL